MIYVKDHKQQQLFDPWDFLSHKRRQMLDSSWYGLFKEHLLEQLPVKELIKHFDSCWGRPSKELYSALGVLLLQQTMDLTDEQTVEQLAFNIQWHYALNITSESDAAKYISAKTLWNMRQIMLENDIDQSMFDALTTTLARVFSVDVERQRLDSVHIRSNMRRLGRIGIFVRTIRKFLVNLKRQVPDAYAGLDADLCNRYTVKKQLAAFSMVKPSESARTLSGVSADLYALCERFKDNEAVRRLHSFKLMQRVLAEQCDVKQGEDTTSVTVKASSQVAGNSLQNPSDPDAAYSGHKGQGYKVQLMETFVPADENGQKEQGLSLISHVEVQKASEHDSTALVPAIEQSVQNSLGPQTVLADTHYGSDENVQAARNCGVTLIAPVINGGKQTDKICLSHFNFDDTGKVTSCPAGRFPQSVKSKRNKGKLSACFAVCECDKCPMRPNCPVVPGKKGYYLRYDQKQYRLAVRRAFERTEAFVDTYRYRAGVEATMSQLDRRTGIKKLRVRGFAAVRYCATLKAAGLNLLRAARLRAARKRADQAQKGSCRSCFKPFPLFKEHIGRFFARLGAFLLTDTKADDYCLKIAA